jgi:hypothetical protein
MSESARDVILPICGTRNIRALNDYRAMANADPAAGLTMRRVNNNPTLLVGGLSNHTGFVHWGRSLDAATHDLILLNA